MALPPSTEINELTFVVKKKKQVHYDAIRGVIFQRIGENT